jgi:outer membrane protein assembly factor BamB
MALPNSILQLKSLTNMIMNALYPLWNWHRCAAAAGLAVSLVVMPSSLANDWPHWRGPTFDGKSAESGWSTSWPQEGPKRVWQADVGIGYSSVSVSAGRLYTMGNKEDVDHVFCLDANTGKELWNHAYPCPAKDPNGFHGTRCTPTVDGDLVFSVSRDGHLFCLATATGKVVWSKNFKEDFNGKKPTWGYAGSPLVEGNLVIFEAGGPGASLVAADKTNGKVVWQVGDDPVGYSSAVPFTSNGQRCLAMFNAAAVVGRSVADGKELWRFPWKTSYDVSVATPIIDGDKVFISSNYGSGCALIQFGEQPAKALWRNKNMKNHVDSCILWQGGIYGFDESSMLRCLDANTGELKWSQRGMGKGSLTFADGKFIVFSERGKLSVADLSTTGFKEITSAQILEGEHTWAPPVLANGKIYCRSLQDLVCLDVSGKTGGK